MGLMLFREDTPLASAYITMTAANPEAAMVACRRGLPDLIPLFLALFHRAIVGAVELFQDAMQLCMLGCAFPFWGLALDR
jgi:hypothetical protein